MIESHTVNSIMKRLDKELPRKVNIFKKEPIPTMHLMTTLDMSRPTQYQTVEIEEERNSKLVGFLFSHPASKLAKEEIVNHLPHFHLRSGEAVDFFCVGYGAYWPPEHHSDQEAVIKIEGVNWLFSEKAFSEVIDELESLTKWKYSGEVELLLVSAVKEKSGKTSLNFDNAITCNLESMSKDKAFTSVRAFFSSLFNYAKKHSTVDATWGLSDAQGVAVLKSALKEAVLSLLPNNFKESYKKAEHYAVRNLSPL